MSKAKTDIQQMDITELFNIIYPQIAEASKRVATFVNAETTLLNFFRRINCLRSAETIKLNPSENFSF